LAASEQKEYGSIENKEVFILCETCHWCATYFFFDKSRLPTKKCPICMNTQMSSFPILSNEAFTFDYNEKRGVSLEFRVRKNNNNNKKL
jgi:hypothetical protein